MRKKCINYRVLFSFTSSRLFFFNLIYFLSFPDFFAHKQFTIIKSSESINLKLHLETLIKRKINIKKINEAVAEYNKTNPKKLYLYNDEGRLINNKGSIVNKKYEKVGKLDSSRY